MIEDQDEPERRQRSENDGDQDDDDGQADQLFLRWPAQAAVMLPLGQDRAQESRFPQPPVDSGRRASETIARQQQERDGRNPRHDQPHHGHHECTCAQREVKQPGWPAGHLDQAAARRFRERASPARPGVPRWPAGARSFARPRPRTSRPRRCRDGNRWSAGATTGSPCTLRRRRDAKAPGRLAKAVRSRRRVPGGGRRMRPGLASSVSQSDTSPASGYAVRATQLVEGCHQGVPSPSRAAALASRTESAKMPAMV